MATDQTQRITSSTAKPDQLKADQPVPNQTKPDPASVHILYAGNLADDDFMWIVECTIEEFQKMLTAPVDWVRNLSTLPDWHFAGTREPAPAPVLLSNFAMRIQQREVDSPSDLITIQGISYTGIISVRASHASAVTGVQNLKTFTESESYAMNSDDGLDDPISASSLKTFWTNLAYDGSNAPTYKKLYAVNVDTTDSRYYGHFEICLPGQASVAQMTATSAAFILALGSDPAGFVGMLNTLPQTTTYISPYGVTSGAPISMISNKATSPQILYTSLDDNTYAICGILDGAYDAAKGTGVLDNPVVKKYGVDTPK